MTESSLVILRAAEATDAESIAVLHAESWQRTYRGMMPDAFLDGEALADRRRLWRERFQSEDRSRYVCVAQHAGEVLGFVCAFARRDPRWGSLIDNLHVVRRVQGQGLGRRLMHAAASWLDVQSADEGVYLWVMAANAPARRFYDRLGGSNAEVVEQVNPGGGRAPNCRYVWPSPGALLVQAAATRPR